MTHVVLLIADIRKAGGTERAVINLANDLFEKGYLVSILSIFTTEGTPFYALDSSISISHLGVRFQTSLLKRCVTGFSELVHKLRTYYLSYSGLVYIATDPFVSFAMSFIHKKRSDNKLVVCEHMAFSISKFYSVWFRKLFFKKIDALVLLTERDLEFATEHLPYLKREVIPNRISFYPTTLADCQDQVILSIGRLEIQKNYNELISICEPILRNHKDWKLKIVGSGTQKDALMILIERLQIQSQIEIQEPTSNVENLFYNSGIYAMSSIYEGFPMVLLEAKAYGLPLVAFDCPNGPKELIDNNIDGFLISLHDRKKYQDALEKLIEDASNRKRMGIVGANLVQKKYSKEHIISKWERLIEQL